MTPGPTASRGWSAGSQYAPAGGAVPIRVRGALVGVLAVSGLESTEDHELAVSALRDVP